MIRLDEYDDYEALFDPTKTDRQGRRKRKPRVNPKSVMQQQDKVNEVADTIGLEGGFNTTYKPSRHEEGWLLDSLRGFFDQELISDVMAVVKGGKEASVYRCKANPATGMDWVAAKVYRPRMFRNLRNDKMYRSGRVVLQENGRSLDGTDQKAIRSLGKKTAYGQQVAHTSWLMHEYTTMEILFKAKAAVPKPIAAGMNAILMGYVGDERVAAPTLNQINLERDEAIPLFQEVMHHVELLLQNGRIHGDLSAYNILYWQGEITLIDFPQVVNSHVTKATHQLGSQVNPDAFDILERDITRICEYFSQFGVSCHPQRITDTLWNRYTHTNEAYRLADASWYDEKADDEEENDSNL